MVKDRRAFQLFLQHLSCPDFSTKYKEHPSRSYLAGYYGCVSKILAISEIRSMVGSLVIKFDICFAPGQDGSRVEKHMKDQLTAAPGKLELTFRKRP